MINLSKQHIVNAEQAPPLNFQIEIESKQSNNNRSKYLCKLCASNKQRFFCKKCMQKGLFTFTTSEERFIDKQQKLTNVINAQKILNAEFSEKFKMFTKLENLRLSLTKCRKNNALLKDLIQAKKENIQKLQEIKRENHEKNRSLKIILPKYEDKVNKLGDYVMIAIEKNDDLRKKSNEQNEKLRVLRRSNVEKLVKYIFPITAKESFIYQSDSESTASDEASRNENSSTKEYVISNGPSLSNQNYYYEYCKWLAFNKDCSNTAGNNNDSGMEVMTHKAYSTIAALTYIVQLINALSFYLDVRLHHKITCNDFCKVLLNEQQFRRKVSKLNFNVAYFLYAHKKSCAQSSSIMENVLRLLKDDKDETLIATEGIDSTSISLSFTDLNDENLSDDSDDDADEDDVAHNKEDWENIPTIEVAQHHHTLGPQETSAMSSTIMNNITSVANSLFWNRWNK